MKIPNITGDEVKVLLFIIGIILIGAAAYYRAGPKSGVFYVQDEGGFAAERGEQPAVTVDVSGAVWRPGVYTLPAGSRVSDALEKAMPRADADIDRVNRARKLVDGQKIVVPSEGAPPAAGVSGSGSDRININSASVEQLMSLPGIGRVRAEEIVAFREEKGRFAEVDDLKKIPGIGDSTVERLRGRVVAE